MVPVHQDEPHMLIETFKDLGPADVRLQLDDGTQLLVHSTALTIFSKVFRNVLQTTSSDGQMRFWSRYTYVYSSPRSILQELTCLLKEDRAYLQMNSRYNYAYKYMYAEKSSQNKPILISAWIRHVAELAPYNYSNWKQVDKKPLTSQAVFNRHSHWLKFGTFWNLYSEHQRHSKSNKLASPSTGVIHKPDVFPHHTKPWFHALT